MTTLSLGPVARPSRINAIDVARGFALLGILSVNIKFFAEPFGQVMQLAPPEGVGNMIVHYFTKIFCEGKFYPLFSMLFGMGLMLQRGRADEAGRSIYKPYLRRLAALFLMGLSHALLLWYGDILFVYSLAGTVLLFLSSCRPRTLLIVGGAFLFLSLTLSGGFAALNMFNLEQMKQVEQKGEAGESVTAKPGGASAGEAGTPPAIPTPHAPPAAPPTTSGDEPGADAASAPKGDASTPAGDAPSANTATGDATGASGAGVPRDQDFERFLDRTFSPKVAEFFKKLTRQKVTGGPKDALWMAAEESAYRDGGFASALAIRALSWGIFLIVCVVGFFWQVGALFCLGGALLKLRFFDPDRAHWRKRAIVVGVVLGLPLSLLGVFGMSLFPNHKVLAGVAMNFGINLGGPLMALAYISICATLVERGVLSGLTRALANAGRMALTNYLCQTLICTTIFYWYGLGLFGSFNEVQRLGVVLAVYAVELAWSAWWLARFRFGPMEWLWRTITYWKSQPMNRAE
ncbi:MAG: DUF418 domain-containing protein [Phycisphaerales bacterium]|jgi:uncharacterized protein|nr:DUF418 domain-containing protein [Phycisphaerales bacterium]